MNQEKVKTKSNSAEFPFESKYLEINGSNMHYIDEGHGDPILFLHGNPTSNYLWRNVIPHLKSHGRCIAPDLIGMGKSDKPNIGYTYDEHFDYLTKFIEKLGLKNITLVIHDWGSGLGFHYANTHRENIKGIAFMEAMYKPMKWSDLPGEYRIAFKMMRAPFIGWLMISVANMFLKKMLPENILRKLSKEEDDYYNMPYPNVKSRKPVRVWPCEVPLGGKPQAFNKKITNYSKWIIQSDLPKLCLYVTPGAIISPKDVQFIKENFKSTKVVDLGEGKHFLQEDKPHEIGEEIASWVKTI